MPVAAPVFRDGEEGPLQMTVWGDGAVDLQCGASVGTSAGEGNGSFWCDGSFAGVFDSWFVEDPLRGQVSVLALMDDGEGDGATRGGLAAIVRWF